MGLWTVKVTDAGHSGSRAQPFAVAVSGVGVNDLRPDPSPIPSSFSTDISIPQVGDDVLVEMQVSNLGNVEAENVEVIFQEEGLFLNSQTFNLGPGGSKILFWNWQPQTAGSRTLTFLVDSSDNIDEINEGNNRMDVVVNVTTPGVRIEAASSTVTLDDINATSSSWQVTLTNTALLTTNASISSTGVTSPSNSALSWYVGLDQTDFELDGQEGVLVNVTLVHPSGPSPGIYFINLLGYDEDNDVSSPYVLTLDVPVLADTRIEFDYTSIPVNPSNVTSVDIRLFNLGNDDIGYDLFLESPPGWYAGFDDLSAQGGANSASTGLMLEDGQMNIGISFTPPQVMTLAGAELTVVLKVVSQSEEGKIVDYELPLVVEEISHVTVDLESSFSSITPGNTISLQYSVENKGNIDLMLNPTLQLPLGWLQNTILEDFELSWTESRNFAISITAQQDARSGEIKLIMDSTQYSWSHSEDIEVVVLPNPALTFASVEINGQTWTNIFGPGQHPTGVPINYTWLVENSESVSWSPTATLQLDNNLLGDCTSPGSISKGDIKPITCTIIISAMADPASEPEFKVVLSGDMVSINESVTMLVALSKEVSWKVDGPLVLETDQPSVLQLTITNTGNTLVSGAIEVSSPNGWDVDFDGADSVDLEAGQSQKIRLDITATKSGSGTLAISISGVEDLENSRIELDVSSEGDAIIEDSSNLSPIILSVLVIIPLIIIIGLVIFLKNRNESVMPSSAPVQESFATPVQQSNTTPCFACRQPILTAMVGCPSCGARYHSTCKVKTCVHCGASSTTFVNVD